MLGVTKSESAFWSEALNMKLTVVLIAFVNLVLSQNPNTDIEVFASAGNGRTNESSALVCEYAVLQTRIDENELLYRETRLMPNGFPHMAAIGYPSADNNVDWLCSGMLITRKHVLTVAHCLEITDGRKAIWVRFGDTDLRNGSDDFNAQTYPIKKCIKHPKYNRIERYYDIGIITLEGKVSLISGVVEPACLPLSSPLPSGEALVTDWGRSPDRDINGREQSLRRSEHQLMPMESCNQSLSILSERSRQRILPQGLDEESMICAKSLHPETASCGGSSGGPLQMYVNKSSCAYAVVGISSFGFGCNRVDEPTIYTKIYPYLSWIQGVVCRQSGYGADL